MSSLKMNQQQSTVNCGIETVKKRKKREKNKYAKEYGIDPILLSRLEPYPIQKRREHSKVVSGCWNSDKCPGVEHERAHRAQR